MNVINTVTLSLPVTEAQQLHIRHLQDTLTKRNATIVELQARIDELETGEPNQSQLKRAYRDGWKAAANEMMNATHEAANALGKLRAGAFRLVLQAEREAAAGEEEARDGE